MDNFHTPVLVSEVASYLNIQKGCWYIDTTLGGGGHSEKILEEGGKVLGIDQDPEAILEVSKKYSKEIEEKNLVLNKGNFVDHLGGLTNDRLVYGVLFDLGISSYQLDNPKRGFSFSKDAPLDMRMDPAIGVKAEDLVNGLYEGELADLFRKLGEEKFAKKIAKKIAEERKLKKIETTKQLADLILSVKPRKIQDKETLILRYARNKIHPATQIFQALRIAVNDELNNLKTALPQALDILEKGGRLVVISFHSLEDRIIKNFFREMEEKGSVKILTKKPITPSDHEILQNPRSRSAKLRALEKI